MGSFDRIKPDTFVLSVVTISASSNLRGRSLSLRVWPSRREAKLLHQSGVIDDPFIGQIVRSVARKASIENCIYPHLLRHTVATRLLNQGMDIADVQKFLGHKDISTTRIYAATSTRAFRETLTR